LRPADDQLLAWRAQHVTSSVLLQSVATCCPAAQLLQFTHARFAYLSVLAALYEKTQTEWRSKWGLFGWANARRGAQWVRKEKPPFSRGRPRHFQLVGLPTFCETASATFR
jgi:hypothetical protein